MNTQADAKREHEAAGAPAEATEPRREGSASAPPKSPAPPKGPRVWVMVLVIGALVVGFVSGTKWGPAASETVQRIIRPASTAEDGASDDGVASFYTCGMHPWVILPDPGQCPICHMELTPLDPDKFSGEVSIDPVVTQNMGVRVAAVESGPVVRTIRTVGTVTYDETRVRDVNIKVPGWIESLNVDYEGVAVKEGEPLFDLYSPTLYAAQGEYLSALKMRRRPDVAGLSETGLDSERLVADARTQLEYYDITAEQIDALETRGTATKTMVIRSPYTGIVIAKHANEGMRVDPGMQVYRIADLTKVWVMVSLYEYQLPLVHDGQEAVMSLPYIPGQTFDGRVVYVYPYLDEATRQVQVRLEFDNPTGLLKPGMYATIELRSTLAKDRILVPREAVIDTGERQVAFVSLGEGRFEPRTVQMGVETEGGKIEILDGLKPGELVVTSGQFLLDSEARLREGLAKMIRGDLASDQKPSVAAEGASELRSLPADLEAELTTALASYFTMGEMLSSDRTKGLSDAARRLAGAVDELVKIEVPDQKNFWNQHDEVATVGGKALEIAGSLDLEAARLAFADLSVALAKLVRATGVPASFGVEVQELHCPMYRDGQGGSTWLQQAGDVRNPFLGAVMLECFDRRTALPVTGATGGGAAEKESAVFRPVSSVEPPPDQSAAHELDGPTQQAVDELVGAYLVIQEKLTRDELEGVTEQVQRMRAALGRISKTRSEAWGALIENLRASTGLDGSSLETLQQGFKALSDGMIELVRIAPPSDQVAPAVYQVHCPMKNADWLQLGEEVSNPYMSSMRKCGTIKEEFTSVVAEGATR